jgi:aspartyl-tRNA(Asn)/glutamyl-tRNA(Gln) amidotransferase subunit C
MDRSELGVTAALALLELSDDESAGLEQAVSQLLEHFSIMAALDVDGLEPTTHALQEVNRLRADAPAHSDLADEILDQAPDLEDRFIAIPNVL